MSKSKFALAGALAAFCVASQAAPVTFLAADNAVSSLAQMVNSTAMAANFIAASGALNVVDFESAIPAGLTITGGTTTNNSGCGALCGFNTTAGCAFFTSVFGGSVTFTFASPVDAFGFYVNGLQTDAVPQQTITYFDGSTTTINMPSSTGGGGAFVGFVDSGNNIVSVTFNATNDILAFDDLRYGRANPIPEPGSLALVGLAGLLAAAARRRA